MLIWLEKVIYIKQLPVSKPENFLKSNFEWNQICKIVFTQNHWILNFKASDFPHFCSRPEKSMEVKEGFKKL